MRLPLDGSRLAKDMKASMGILTSEEKQKEVAQLFLGMVNLVEEIKDDPNFIFMEAPPRHPISTGISILHFGHDKVIMTFPEKYPAYISLYTWIRNHLESPRPWSIERDYFYGRILEILI